MDIEFADILGNPANICKCTEANKHVFYLEKAIEEWTKTHEINEFGVEAKRAILFFNQGGKSEGLFERLERPTIDLQQLIDQQEKNKIIIYCIRFLNKALVTLLNFPSDLIDILGDYWGACVMIYLQLIYSAKNKHHLQIPNDHIQYIVDITKGVKEITVSNITCGLANLIFDIKNYEKWAENEQIFKPIIIETFQRWPDIIGNKNQNAEIQEGAIKLVQIWCKLVELFVKGKTNEELSKDAKNKLPALKSLIILNRDSTLTALNFVWREPKAQMACKKQFLGVMSRLKNLQLKDNEFKELYTLIEKEYIELMLMDVDY